MSRNFMERSMTNLLTASQFPFATIILAAGLAAGSPLPAAAAGSGTWTLTGNLNVARDGHTATILSNGDVVVAGGEGSAGVTASSEFYVPSSGTWTKTGGLAVARAGHGAVLLSSGKVLVAGGCTSQCLGGNTATAELYDPTKGSWSKTGSMATARVYFGMVVLPAGNVLAVGGCTGQNSNGCTGVTAAAETYDPTTGKWTQASTMHAARGSFTATLMSDGKVLVAGGINAKGNPIKSCERFDPVSGSWTVTGQLNVARDEHTATLLSNGEVLVAGGENSNGVTDARTELFNPSTKTWSLTGNMNTSRLEHAAILLGNGEVLLSGGNHVTANKTTVLSGAELYNPGTGVWTNTGSMNAQRVGHTLTLLSSGTVVAAAGNDGNNELMTAEIFQP